MPWCHFNFLDNIVYPPFLLVKNLVTPCFPNHPYHCLYAKPTIALFGIFYLASHTLQIRNQDFHTKPTHFMPHLSGMQHRRNKCKADSFPISQLIHPNGSLGAGTLCLLKLILVGTRSSNTFPRECDYLRRSRTLP